MTRVAGLDPGTVAFDLCALEDGRVVAARSFPTRELVARPERLVGALRELGPLDAVAGPSGYGLPLCRLEELRDADLRLALLATDPEGGIEGLTDLLRTLRGTGLPVWMLPGVVHLPTVPAHRKVNRVDLGTADKLCVAAVAVHEQARRLEAGHDDADFLLVEAGGAFSAALAVRGGRVVDGLGGSSGPPGLLSPGALDGEVAALLGHVGKRQLFGGGAEDVARSLGEDVSREYWLEGIAKACRALLAVHPSPREILLSGRASEDPELCARLTARLEDIAPVRPLRGLGAGSRAAEGAALLADGIAGGASRGLLERLGVHESAGTVFDHLLVPGAPEAAARRMAAWAE